MAENRSRGILNLPLELFLCIIHELYAPDVLSLGQTCNAIRGAVNERRVWEAALRATCRLDQLFEPSYYPIEDLDILELQRAALEPWRRCASFTPELPSDNPSGGEGSVAGGNMLLKEIKLEGDDHRHFYNIWDMSAPEAATVASFRLATMELSSYESFRVFEVGPLPDVFSIREIASLQGISPELHLIGFWLQGDNLVCHFYEGVLVWDFVQSKYIAYPESWRDNYEWKPDHCLDGCKHWRMDHTPTETSGDLLQPSSENFFQMISQMASTSIRSDKMTAAFGATKPTSHVLGIPFHRTR
ncbi:hypothetical protein DFP72DRAFT_1130386 [Ephemerocybe angulata]|uniref:F-box domain-containing protein n=1 Tax=Ephemerocybe angulata TaxID=980116 RepID=A0A8H6IGE3_9AGAR|nr:hypothetical protein DFP72DRAFT_1130386 [Tulosesus angulatus]